MRKITPYNQPSPYGPPYGPPMGMPMDPMMPPPPRKRSWKDVILRNFGGGMHTTLQKGERTIPQWLVWLPILFFFISFAACRLAFGNPMPITYAEVACVFTILFFYGIYEASRKWHKRYD